MTTHFVRPETALSIPLHNLILYDACYRIHVTHMTHLNAHTDGVKSLIELQKIIDRLKTVNSELLGFAQAIGQLWK